VTVHLAVRDEVPPELDLRALIESHRRAGAVASVAVRRLPDAHRHGVVIAGEDGRVHGYQSSPSAAEALSDLADCGVYCFSPEVFDYLPGRPDLGRGDEVLPALLEHDAPVHAFHF